MDSNYAPGQENIDNLSLKDLDEDREDENEEE